MSAVWASGVAAGGGTSSSAPLSGGANTVAGSGTERSSPPSPLVSVPAQGVAPAGTPEEPGAGAGAGDAAEAPADAPAPDPAPRRSGIPNLSAASCNHSGGDNKNDV